MLAAAAACHCQEQRWTVTRCTFPEIVRKIRCLPEGERERLPGVPGATVSLPCSFLSFSFRHYLVKGLRVSSSAFFLLLLQQSDARGLVVADILEPLPLLPNTGPGGGECSSE